MFLTRDDIKRMFTVSSNLLKENCEEFSKIDSKFGDGDHGITVNKIADFILKETAEWKDDVSIKEFIDNLGMGIMGVNGGSAGPLWGTMISGFAVPLEDEKN